MTDAQRTAQTFRYERWRALASGILEAAGATTLQAVAAGFKQAGAGLGVISGARLTNEELFLLKNLAKVAGTTLIRTGKLLSA